MSDEKLNKIDGIELKYHIQNNMDRIKELEKNLSGTIRSIYGDIKTNRKGIEGLESIKKYLDKGGLIEQLMERVEELENRFEVHSKATLPESEWLVVNKNFLRLDKRIDELEVKFDKWRNEANLMIESVRIAREETEMNIVNNIKELKEDVARIDFEFQTSELQQRTNILESVLTEIFDILHYSDTPIGELIERNRELKNRLGGEKPVSKCDHKWYIFHDFNADGEIIRTYNRCLKCGESDIQPDPREKPARVPICWQCRNAVWEEGLDLYEIRCEYDNAIHDENSSCDKFEYNPNYSPINPRIEKPASQEVEYHLFIDGNEVKAKRIDIQMDYDMDEPSEIMTVKIITEKLAEPKQTINNNKDLVQVDVYCPICATRLHYFFKQGKDLIREFLEDLHIIYEQPLEMGIFNYEFINNKIVKWEARLKNE